MGALRGAGHHLRNGPRGAALVQWWLHNWIEGFWEGLDRAVGSYIMYGIGLMGIMVLTGTMNRR